VRKSLSPEIAIVGARGREREVLLRFWQASLPVHLREVQHDRGPIGSLELHGRRGSRKDLKCPRRIMVGETLGPRREG